MRKRHRRWTIACLAVLVSLGLAYYLRDPIDQTRQEAQLRAQAGRFYYLLKLEAAQGTVMLYLGGPGGEQFAELFTPEHPATSRLLELVDRYRNRPVVVEFSLRDPLEGEATTSVSSYHLPRLRDLSLPISASGGLE